MNPHEQENAGPGPSPTSALSRYVPGLSLFSDYRRQWLAGDIMAGISVCIVMIPSVIAYSRLMGLPPQHGLYAALLPLVVYPFFGSSRHVIVGPDIAISLLMASAIAPLAGGDPVRAAALAATLALMSGVLLLLGARAKIGAVADFLSKPVLVGYMTGRRVDSDGFAVQQPFRHSAEEQRFLPAPDRTGRQTGPGARAHVCCWGRALLALLVILRRAAPKFPAALVRVPGRHCRVARVGS